MRTHNMKTEIKIFLFVLGIGLAVFVFLYPRFGYETFTWAGNDATQYDLLAENLISGRGLSIRTEPPFLPSPARMPGYPLILAGSKLLTGGTLLVILLQIAAHALMSVIVYKIARRFVSQKLAVAAAVLAGLHIYFLFLSISLMTETFFTSLLLGSLLFLLKYFDARFVRYAAYSGLLLGISALLRPTTLMLPILWLAVIAAEGLWNRNFLRKNFLALAAFALVFAALLAPWAIRNKIQFDRFALVSANGYGFYVATPVQIIALKEGISRSEARNKLMAPFQEAFKSELERDAQYPDALAFDKFHYSDWFGERNSKIIKENFGIFIKAVFIAIPEFLTKNDWLHPFEKYNIVRPEIQPTKPLYRYWSEEGIVSAAKEVFHRFSCGMSCVLSFGLVAIGRIFYLIVFLFSVAGMWSMLKNKNTRLAGAVLLSLVLYFAAVHLILTGAAGHERYRLPIMPIMLVQSLAGLRYLYSLRTRKTRY